MNILLLFVCAVIGIIGQINSLAAFEQKDRADFAEYPVGQLAYAGQRQKDLDRWIYNVMGLCETLPRGGVYYFVLNNYDETRVGAPGYFLIQIDFFRNDTGNNNENSSEKSFQLELSRSYGLRNAGWSPINDKFGPIVVSSKDIASFFAAHLAANGFANIASNYKNWHARPTADGATTFDLSRNDIINLRSNQPDLKRSIYLLIRVDITGSPRGDKVPFNFQAWDYDSATITVTAPLFPSENETLRRVYKLSFGSPCSP